MSELDDVFPIDPPTAPAPKPARVKPKPVKPTVHKPAPVAPAPVEPAPTYVPIFAPYTEDTAVNLLDAAASEAILALTPQEIKYLEGYATHGVPARAAKDAGYKGEPKSKRLLAAMQGVQRSVVARFQYDVVAAFEDIESVMQYARENGSAMALVGALKLKLAVAGHGDKHVTGKIDHNHVHEIVDTRTDAELRAHALKLARDLGLDNAGAIEAEFKEIPDDE